MNDYFLNTSSSFVINNYPVILIFWNIFLALIPCVIVYWMGILFQKKWSKFNLSDRFKFLALFFIWFFFFPNTAYLFTMVRHLLNHCMDYDMYRVCREETWMVPVFFTYALIGVPTFIYALKRMETIVAKIFHQKIATIFSIIIMPVTALGILLGLIDRYNSWEIAIRPLEITEAALNYFTDSTMFLNFLVYTLILYLIYYIR